MCELEQCAGEGVSRTDAYPGTNPFRSCQTARQYLTLMRAAAHYILDTYYCPLRRAHRFAVCVRLRQLELRNWFAVDRKKLFASESGHQVRCNPARGGRQAGGKSDPAAADFRQI